MFFEQTKNEDGTTKIKKDEIYDADGDGHESVSEYIEKKKITPEGEEEVTEKKKKGSEKDKEVLEKVGKVAGTVSNVISSVPKFAAFSLGAGAGAGAEKFANLLRQLIKENNGNE